MADGPATEIEVTPAMIEAAHPYLWDEQVMPYEDCDEVLVKIYRAMETARRADPSQGAEERLRREISELKERVDAISVLLARHISLSG